MSVFFQKTFAYVSYDMDENATAVIEFAYNYGKTDYAKGTGYAQVLNVHLSMIHFALKKI